ncbi:MAG TPA: Vms1/Ankzf1 family peptidyl-tRNA hydrolase [Dehalococcoidia bacterium]|jgi:hypothetical protein
MATRKRLSKRALIARLPEEGSPGVTVYSRPFETPVAEALPEAESLLEAASESDTGSVLFITDDEAALVIPPFPQPETVSFDAINATPLVELLDRSRMLGVLLLRLGGYTVGILRDDSIIDSKTGTRFVKNRHRKGGQSQRRFDRIREKQTDELFEAACETAKRMLVSYDAQIEHVFLGGTKQTLIAFRKECAFLDRFGPRLRSHVLTVTSDPRRASLDDIAHEIWSSDVYTLARTGTPTSTPG